MDSLRPFLLAGLLLACACLALGQTPPSDSAKAIENGRDLFSQHCGFCHGRDAGGGETGPDLTKSKVTADDVKGDKLTPVIRNGRADKGMPAFALPDADVTAMVAYIHDQKTQAETRKGGRRGVEEIDLQTGNAAAGKQYFNGAGKCASCHSPAGNLAGVATRLKGLALMQRMLYPRNVKAKVMVTLRSGEVITGELVSRDEFTIAMRDSSHRYRSWRTSDVKDTVDDPAEAHAELLGKYTDDDIHNLMAYLQTLK